MGLNVAFVRRLGMAMTLSLLSLQGGCVLPTQPSRAPVGVMYDQDGLSLVFRACQNEQPLNAKVSKPAALNSWNPVWTGDDYRGSNLQVIKLTDSDWGRTTGQHDTNGKLELTGLIRFRGVGGVARGRAVVGASLPG